MIDYSIHKSSIFTDCRLVAITFQFSKHLQYLPKIQIAYRWLLLVTSMPFILCRLMHFHNANLCTFFTITLKCSAKEESFFQDFYILVTKCWKIRSLLWEWHLRSRLYTPILLSLIRNLRLLCHILINYLLLSVCFQQGKTMFFEAYENVLQIWLSQDIRIKVEYHKYWCGRP